jgi:hypothetical protein
MIDRVATAIMHNHTDPWLNKLKNIQYKLWESVSAVKKLGLEILNKFPVKKKT